jgi:hypothetical protein
MTTEELRNKLMNRIDALLGRTLLVWGEDRQLLTALRAYVSVMPDDELKKVQTYLAHTTPEEKPHGH